MKKLIGLLILSVCGAAVADVDWPPQLRWVSPSQPTQNDQIYIAIWVGAGTCSSIENVSTSGSSINVSAHTNDSGGGCPLYGGPWEGTLMIGPLPPGSHNIYANLTETRTYGGTRTARSLLTTINVVLAIKFTDSGSIVGWGANLFGEAIPPAGKDFVAIAAGYHHGLALRANGSIIGWGFNDEGQATPPAGNDFVAIAAGFSHSLALRANGSIVGWGLNEYGQATPPAGSGFVAIAGGRNHSLALRSDGSIVGWGWNGWGQATPPAGNNFVAIAAGGFHSLALRNDSSIVGWGENNFGQATPPAGNDFVAIAAGYEHSIALRTDGSIVGWGLNDDGQATPPAGNDFVSIATKGYYCLSLRADGSLIDWGIMIGDYPVGNVFLAITGGGSSFLALKKAGKHDSGDLDGDADVDLADLKELAFHWLQAESTIDIAPSPSGDGVVNMLDFGILAENWWMGIAPLARWCFDGNWADSTGEHNGTAVGDPDWVAVDQARVGGGAAEFDGDDMVLMEGYKGILRPTGPNLHGLDQDNCNRRADPVLGQQRCLGRNVGVCGSVALDSFDCGRWWWRQRKALPVNTGQWTHVAVVLPSWGNSVTDVLLYVNGVRQARSAIAQRWVSTVDGADFRIGANDSGNYFTGLIDDVRLYDRN